MKNKKTPSNNTSATSSSTTANSAATNSPLTSSGARAASPVVTPLTTAPTATPSPTSTPTWRATTRTTTTPLQPTKNCWRTACRLPMPPPMTILTPQRTKTACSFAAILKPCANSPRATAKSCSIASTPTTATNSNSPSNRPTCALPCNRPLLPIAPPGKRIRHALDPFAGSGNAWRHFFISARGRKLHEIHLLALSL